MCVAWCRVRARGRREAAQRGGGVGGEGKLERGHPALGRELDRALRAGRVADERARNAVGELEAQLGSGEPRVERDEDRAAALRRVQAEGALERAGAEHRDRLAGGDALAAERLRE